MPRPSWATWSRSGKRKAWGPDVRSLVVSVISHGHGEQVRKLLHQLAAQAEPTLGMVVLTLNQAEPELVDAIEADAAARAWPFTLVQHQNLDSLGFGANHNQAFRAHALNFWRDQGLTLEQGRFAVVNPDIALKHNPFPALLARLSADDGLACVYPVQCDARGVRQDFERLLPTPASVGARAVWSLRKRLGRPHAPQPPGQPEPGEAPDWVSAAFLLLRAKAWREVDGFDPSFFMYGEDVDLCLRLQLAGWQLAVEPRAKVVHVAQRNSHRNVQHLLWHVKSLWQLWQSKPYRAFRRTRGA